VRNQACSTRDRADGVEHLGRFLVGHGELVHADLQTFAVHLQARREPLGSGSRRDQKPDVETFDEHGQELLRLIGPGCLPLVHDEEDLRG
jgi:hypothetical protein